MSFIGPRYPDNLRACDAPDGFPSFSGELGDKLNASNVALSKLLENLQAELSRLDDAVDDNATIIDRETATMQDIDDAAISIRRAEAALRVLQGGVA